MPTKVKRASGNNTAYASALIGNYETLHALIDVSALTASQVDTRGYLKPNVPLSLSGVALSSASAVAQVETATVAGTITGAGTVTVKVTSALLDGGSKTLNVAVANSDDASAVAGKIRTALAADADIIAVFSVSGATTAVVLTALVAAPNDTTLNIATANGTATGLTAAPTSANTTAGVAGSTGQVPCVTVEAVKVAESNQTADLNAAQDVLVAMAVNGTLNRDIVEDTLGRVLLPAEIAALNGPNSKLVLSLT
jgi:phage tail sheath gpL-like